MPTRELIGKTIAFIAAAASSVGAGVLVLIGPHMSSDGFNTGIGWGLVAFGVVVAGVGGLMIAGILYSAHLQEKQRRLHVAPRPGAPGPPPPRGMGDVGRIDRVVHVGDAGIAPRAPGGGAVRIVNATVVGWDAPLVIGAAFIVTAVLTYLLAPR